MAGISAPGAYVNPHDAVGPNIEAQHAGIEAHQYAVRLFFHPRSRRVQLPTAERNCGKNQDLPAVCHRISLQEFIAGRVRRSRTVAP